MRMLILVGCHDPRDQQHEISRRPSATPSSTTCTASPIPDPYRWLEDGRKPEVKAWMAAEDKLARGFTRAAARARRARRRA